MKYLEFMDAVGPEIGVKLTAAQREFARVAFDHELPSATPEGLKLWGWSPLASEGFRGNVPEEARRVVAAVCGRGSGKTALGGTRLLHLALTVDISKLSSREKALCPIVSTDVNTAQQAVRVALGCAEALKLKIAGRTADGEGGFTIYHKSGKPVRIAPRAATARGRGLRGYSIPGAVLDEFAFFRDSGFKVNDAEIFKSIRPRLMDGGQIVILSSPWMESGMLYDMWRRNYGRPIDALVAHAPTGLMRSDDAVILRDIELERRVDPESTARERDAEFMTSNAQAFFDPRSVASALVDGELEKRKDCTHAVGGDFAFKRNSTAFAAVQLYELEATDTAPKKRVFEVIDLLEMRPEGEPLKPSVICSEGAQFARDNYADSIVADGHYRESIVENLLGHGITHTIAPAGNVGKTETFQVVRSLLHEGSVRIPRTVRGSPITADRLIRQLRETVVRPLPGGGLAIDNPTWRSGEHGDLVSAFVLAVWRVYKLGVEEEVASQLSNADPIERRLMEEAAVEEERARRYGRLTGMTPEGFRDNFRVSRLH